jgi:hypothetical protein
MLLPGAYSESFSETFPKGCLGCSPGIEQAKTGVYSMVLPAGKIELIVDTVVSPRYLMGYVTGPTDFIYRTEDQVTKQGEGSGSSPGVLIEEKSNPEGVGIDGQPQTVHRVTSLNLPNPLLLEVSIPPSIWRHGGGPADQMGQTKEITITYRMMEETDRKDSGARFSSLSGQVEVRHENEEEWNFAKMDTILYVGDHIKTGEDSSAVIGFADMSTFLLKSESEIVVSTPPSKDSKLGLVLGKLWVNVKHMMKNECMEIDMSQAVAGIKGTTFVCEETGSSSNLKVIEGTVTFASKTTGDETTVRAGEMVSATAEGLQGPMEFDVASEKTSWEGIGELQPNDAIAAQPASGTEFLGRIYQWVNWNTDGVQNGPPAEDTAFMVEEPVSVTYIDTYHWNDGRGVDSPGTVVLKRDGGSMYGPIYMSGSEGSGGAPNAIWSRTFDAGEVVLEPGIYTVIDSDPATWSSNMASSNAGFFGIQWVATENTASAASTAPTALIQPGASWMVKEYGSSGNWDGVWTIRDDGRTVDASWSGGITDIIDIQSVVGDQITLFRHSNSGYYTGTISDDGLSVVGYASWKPDDLWTVSLSRG